MNKRGVVAIAVAALVFGGLGGVAMAQVVCNQPVIWDNGLTVLCANKPALADDVNGNFSRLVKIIQDKVGSTSTPGISTTTAATFGNTTVNGHLDAASIETRILMYPSNPLPQTGTVTWAAAPGVIDSDLTLTWTTTQPQTTADIEYSVTGTHSSTTSFLVTHVVLDGTVLPETKAISNGTLYPRNSGRAVAKLAPGTHTAVVRYRATETITFQLNADYMSKSLRVVLLGR
jgi:hypothetical protein